MVSLSMLSIHQTSDITDSLAGGASMTNLSTTVASTSSTVGYVCDALERLRAPEQ